MKINIKNPLIDNACVTILFYVLLAGLSYALEFFFPSARCAAGPGMLLLLGLPFISGLLLILNGIKFFRGNASVKISLLIHFLVLLFFLIYVKWF